MGAGRALVAVLLALLLALGTALAQTPDASLRTLPQAETRRAAPPLPAELPGETECGADAPCALLSAAALKHPQHSRWVAVCLCTLRVPRCAAQCHADHPHHAPPGCA